MQDEKYLSIWNGIQNRIKGYDGVDALQVDAFFSRLHLQAFTEGFIMLTADNAFIKKWIERQYLHLINQALQDLYHTSFLVNIEVDEAGAVQEIQESRQNQINAAPTGRGTARAGAAGTNGEAENPNPMKVTSQQKDTGFPSNAGSMGIHGGKAVDIADGKPPQSAMQLAGNPESDITSRLNPQMNIAGSQNRPIISQNGAFSKMSFENYIIGDSNRMAYSMALAVAEHPGEEHLNPLFIYGKSGVGKTHLLVSIKNYLDRNTSSDGQPLVNSVYVDSSEFINDYADASADHSREKTSFRSFKERYEEADVLLIDDVQSFQGKKETLKIVFELFNKLTSQGKQVVMSADIAPKNIDIDERYQSRFNSGATFDIQAPELETKLSIINSAIEDRIQSSGETGIDIPFEVRSYIAEISSSNIRELKSAVTIVFLHLMTAHQRSIDVDQASLILENHFSNDIRLLTITDIQKAVEEFYKVSHTELVGKGRRHAVAYPRQVAMYLCRELMEETFDSIGKAFGGKDHSTVKYSVDLIGQKIKEDKGTRDEIDIVINQIKDR